MSNLSAEVEAALLAGFRAVKDMEDALGGRGQNDLDTIESALATLRTALERAGRIEAVAKVALDHLVEVGGCRDCIVGLRAALNEEGA
jgi:hypothetical protein